MPFPRNFSGSPVLGRRTLLLGLAAGAAGATGVAGVAALASRASVAADPTPDPVLHWYDAMSSEVPPSDIFESRKWAIAWLAAARVLRSGETDPAWKHAALVGALHGALVGLAPGDSARFNPLRDSGLAQIPAGPARDRGLTAGRSAADALVAERANDKINWTTLNGTRFPTPPAGPGVWQPTPPANLVAGDMYGSRLARPFVLDSVSQFRPAPPPALNSEQYRIDLDEVRSYGSVNSATRTPGQLAVAQFWYGGVLAIYTPALRAALEQFQGSLADKVRLVALFHVANVDTQLATYEAKYTYNRWRPVTAIRTGAIDPDPQWLPVHTTPNVQDYPSAHNSGTGSAEGVLTALFGPRSARPFTVTSSAAADAPRTYTAWQELSRDNLNARVWSGIHFRSTDNAGRDLGLTIADYTVRNAGRLGV